MPDGRPRVSVVILNHNTPELTRRCVASVLERTSGVDHEIVLVENGSTARVDRAWIRDRGDRVRLVRSEENLGFAAGNNLGLEHARGERVLLLNSDTELRNDAIAIALEALEEEDVGVVSSRLVSPDGSLQHPCRRFPGILRELAEALRLHRLLPPSVRQRWLQGSYFPHESRLETDSVWGTFFFFRREVLECFPDGRLTETFFMYGEDMEWSWIIRQCGYRILYVPEAEILHHGGGSGFDQAVGASGGTAATIYRHRARFLLMYRGRLFAWAWALAHTFNAAVSRAPGRGRRLRAVRAMFSVLRGRDRPGAG